MNVRIDYQPGGAGGKPPRRTPTQGGGSDRRPPDRRPRKRRDTLLLGAVGVGVLSLVAALFFVPGDEDKGAEGGKGSGSKPGPSTSAGPSDAPGLSRGKATAAGELGTQRIGGIPRGFPRTETGAVEAAVTVSANNLQMQRLPEDQRRAYLKSVYLKVPADSEERAELWRSQNNINRDGKLIDPATGKADPDKRFTSLCHPELGAYKVEDYTARAAVVTVWNPCLSGVLDTAAATSLENRWFLAQLELRWAQGDWRVSKTGAGSYGPDVPAPASASGTPAVSYRERARLLRQLGSGWNLTADATAQKPAELKEAQR